MSLPGAPGDPVVGLAYRVCRAGAWLGGILFIVAAVLVGVEVVIRKSFGATIGGADELSGYALAIASAWAYGFALLERAHIRIDTLYVILPVRLAALLDLLAITLFLAFFCLVAWYGYEVLHQSVVSRSRSMTPLSIPLVVPQSLWFAGLLSVVVTAALLLARSVWLFATGDLAALRRLAGSRSAVEEVEGEMALQLEERQETGPSGSAAA